MELVYSSSNHSPHAKPTYFIGLDLGQAQDYTALAILERPNAGGGERTYLCRHLQRWPLKTSYPTIVADVSRIVRSPELKGGQAQATLALDATGVGAPVVDMFRAAHLPVHLVPIQITGGSEVSHDGDVSRVPKRDLVSSSQVALQTGRLKIAPELPDAQTLVRELQNFQVKINLETAHDSYGAWREGTHDDLVLAVALALWVAESSVGAELFIFRR